MARSSADEAEAAARGIIFASRANKDVDSTCWRGELLRALLLREDGVDLQTKSRRAGFDDLDNILAGIRRLTRKAYVILACGCSSRPAVNDGAVSVYDHVARTWPMRRPGSGPGRWWQAGPAHLPPVASHQSTLTITRG